MEKKRPPKTRTRRQRRQAYARKLVGRSTVTRDEWQMDPRPNLHLRHAEPEDKMQGIMAAGGGARRCVPDTGSRDDRPGLGGSALDQVPARSLEFPCGQ